MTFRVDGMAARNDGGSHAVAQCRAGHFDAGFVPHAIGQEGSQRLRAAFDKERLHAVAVERVEQLAAVGECFEASGELVGADMAQHQPARRGARPATHVESGMVEAQRSMANEDGAMLSRRRWTSISERGDERRAGIPPLRWRSMNPSELCAHFSVM